MGFYKKWLQVQKEQTPVPESVKTLETFPEKPIAANFPDTCPFVTGGVCPPGCRFENRFFIRMIQGGVLPDPDTGCPLLKVCGLK